MTIVNSMKKNQMIKKKKDLPPVEGDEEEVKKIKGIKISTPEKQITILLPQIKAGNN